MSSRNREASLRYYRKNRVRINVARKKYRIGNLRLKRWEAERPLKCIKTWENYFSKIHNCQVCGKEISFNRNNTLDVIHFDHRINGVEKIIKSPSVWLRKHIRSDKNEKIWELCNFGALCKVCNIRLPTKSRNEFLENAIKYVNSYSVNSKEGRKGMEKLIPPIKSVPKADGVKSGSANSTLTTPNDVANKIGWSKGTETGSIFKK